MVLKAFLRTFLVSISYYSIKKFLDKIPQPYRRIVVLSIKGCVFFMIFLILFSFLTGRIDIIARNVNIGNLIKNIFIGVSLFLSLVLAIFLTAAAEETYRRVSALAALANKKAAEGKKIVTAPVGKVKRSIKSTKATVYKTGQLAKKSTVSLYETSTKVTSLAVDKVAGSLRKIFKRK